jgi:uncharacterized protein YaeQ
MTFVEAFYSFKIEINDTERSVFETVRVKAARHPYEPLQHLYARMIAWCHCFRPGQKFGPYHDQKEPAIGRHDAIGTIDLWVEVGETDRKKLERALRAAPQGEFRIYFYNQEQIQHFSALLKGSKSNWISNIQFYLINRECLDSLIPLEKSSAVWSVTIMDQSLYLTADGQEFVTELERVDMWQAFQELIGN